MVNLITKEEITEFKSSRLDADTPVANEETDEEFFNIASVGRLLDVENGRLQLIKTELMQVIELIDTMQTVIQRRERKHRKSIF